MNKKPSPLFLILCFAISIVILFEAGVFSGKGNNFRHKKTVIATTFSAYDWTRNILKNTKNVEVKYLVNTAVDLHSYQPSAADIVAYKNADLVICIGGESEEWLEELDLPKEKVICLMDSIAAMEEETVEGMEIEEEEEEEEGPEYDEHIWLSLKNAQKACKTICSEISKLDNEYKAKYASNTKKYTDRLASLDESYENLVLNSKNKTLLFGDRFPFRYMVEDYGLTYYAAFIGCSAETEASFKTIGFLSKKVDELGLKTICVIGENQKIANAIRENTETGQQKIVTFNSLQSVPNTDKKTTYLSAMKNNLAALSDALD